MTQSGGPTGPTQPPRGPGTPGNPPQGETGRHRYRVIYVPDGCEDYLYNDHIDLEVPEPPPATVMISTQGPCNGVYLALDE